MTGGPADFRHALAAIVPRLRAFARFLARAERRTRLRLDPGASSAPAQRDTAGLHALGRAIDGLPATQREALVLVVVLGFPIEEAAAISGMPTGTVTARASRARAAAARRFQGKG